MATVLLECGCTIINAETRTVVPMEPGRKMGCPNCAASVRITTVLSQGGTDQPEAG